MTTFLATAVAVAGCDSQSDVLSTSTVGQLQKADGTWTNWCATSHDSFSDMAGFMIDAQQGLSCTESNQLMACATGLDSHGCGWNIRNCVDQRVQATTTETVGCPVSGDSVGTDVWTDCASALAGGNSGDPCSWQGACSRTTDDPCCIEAAICSIDMMPQNIVQRNRICAPGCTGIAPDTSKPKVSTCTELPFAIDEYAVPCDSALACYRTGPSSFVGLPEVESAFLIGGPLYFCADGKVMFVQEPFATRLF